MSREGVKYPDVTVQLTGEEGDGNMKTIVMCDEH